MKKTCLTLASAALGALALSTLAAPFAYVPNEESGTISVIDTSTDQVVKEIKAGDKPRGRLPTSIWFTCFLCATSITSI